MRTITQTIPGRCIVFLALSLASTIQAQQLPSDLSPITAADTTHFSPNYYSLQKLSSWPPLPFNWLGDSNVQLYASSSLGTNAIFVNDLATDYVQLAAESQVLRLAARAASDVPPVPGGDDGDSGGDSGGGTNYATRVYTTNDFYLEAAATNASLCVLVHTPNPESFFDLFWAPAVPVTNGWWWIARGLPGQLAFNLSLTNLSGDMGFFAAGTTNGMDASGLTDAYRALVGGVNTLTNDLNQDGLPDWWEIKYFGDLSQSATNDYDGDGVLNGDESAQGNDPNKIIFAARFPNSSVNSSTAHGTFDIYGGVPSQMAILNTNDFGAAQWQPYTPDFTVALGPTDGVYNVWIGLRGRSADSRQTWAWSGLTRDLQPPAIEITAPAALVTAQPLIDLRGYSPERLRNLYYDVANDAGTVTNVQGFITDQYYDPNCHEFTTNWFLCADIQLRNGANTITLRATDLAGNVSTNVFTYTLDLAAGTNPPVLTLYWPQDGEMVCGSQFTLRGRLDDPTATLAAQITDPAGNVNTVKGLVERNGLVWVEGLPLASGTNTVILTMTNAAGYPSMTNFMVIQSDDVNLTINDVPGDQLSTGLVTVTGTIDSADFTVWVNGVIATNLTDNGNGTWLWEADGVLLNTGGTAIIQAVAIPNSANGGQGTGTETPVDNAVPGNPTALDRRAKETDAEQEAATYVKYYHYTLDDTWETASQSGAVQDCHYWVSREWMKNPPLTPGPIPANGLLVGIYKEGEFSTMVYPGGSGTEGGWGNGELDYLFPFPPAGQPGRGPGYWAYNTATNPAGTVTRFWGTGPQPDPRYKIWEEHTPYWGESWDLLDWGQCLTTGYKDIIEGVQIKLRTGGKRLSNRQNFFSITGWATNYPTMDYNGFWIPQAVPPSGIQVLGKPLIGTDMPYPQGMNYKVLADNEEHDITPAIQAARCNFAVSVEKHKLVMAHHCVIGGDTNRTSLGVGEQVNLSFAPDLYTNSVLYNTWSTTAGSVVPTFATSTDFTAPSNAVPATVTAKLNDEKLDVAFGVAEPRGVDHVTLSSLVPYTPSFAGAGMHVIVYLAPTNVSFYRVTCMEVGEDATGITNFFSQWTPQQLRHTTADVPIPVGCDNSWDSTWDVATMNAYKPWGAGGYTWPIPGKWWVDPSQQKDIHFSDQTFEIRSDGTAIVTKFKHSVTRGINQTTGTFQ
jgi:hypothetical protein